MAQYRLKLGVVEAVSVSDAMDLYRNDRFSEAPEWLIDAYRTGKFGFASDGLKLITLEGCIHASLTDVVIKGVRGDLQRCSQDSFAQTYEPVHGEATPVFAWTDLAASAYRAYAACTGGKNFRGEPMPAFEEMPIAIQTAWEAATRHVSIVLEQPVALNHRKEKSWEHWVRPQDIPTGDFAEVVGAVSDPDVAG